MKVVIVLLLAVTMVTGLLFGDEDEMIEEPWAEVDSECLRLADAGHCDFYKCFVRRYPCARRLLEFGLHPTCSRMSSRKGELNDEGKQWLTNSRRCFHTHLKTQYSSDSLACSAFKDTTVAAYMNCADTVSPNMCQIFYDNRRVISEVLNITMDQVLDNPRLGMKNIFGLIRMMSGCGRSQVRTYFREIKAELARVLLTKRPITFPWQD